MLAHERRASPNTLRAYGDDVARFIGFQAAHVVGAVMLATLAVTALVVFSPPELAQAATGGGAT